MEEEEARIGVFICHCGSNIAGKVDTKEIAIILRETIKRFGV